VLQAAAVIGQDFPQPVLARVVELDATDLDDSLGALIGNELVYEQDLDPDPVFAFTHPLTREVAYRSQLAEHRTAVHAAVAQAFTDHYPDRLDEQAALIAQHWESASETLAAAQWHTRAGNWIGNNDASRSLQHWRKVRDLADALPESPESMGLGLFSRIHLLDAGFRLGLPIEEARLIFEEAEPMAAKAGNVAVRAALLTVYATVHCQREGNVREAARLAREGIALAEEAEDPAIYVALSVCAYFCFCSGEPRESVAICDRALELADGDPTVGAGITIACPYAFALGFKGVSLGVLGEFEQAGQLIEQSRTIAAEQGDLESVGTAHLYSAYLAYIRGEPKTTYHHARELVQIAERIGSSYFRARAWSQVGLAETMRGNWDSAIKALERYMQIAREGHTAAEWYGTCAAWLAEAHLGAGDPERARALAEEALAYARKGGQVMSEGEVSLVLARSLLGSAGVAARAQIEAALARALEVGRLTGATILEPFVHVELAELARQLAEEEVRERELREAHRLFAQIGATGRAEAISAQLSESAGVGRG
jgi:adenylate cyclase